MRRHWAVVVILLSACTTQGVDRARRWPEHRKQGDARFAELERRNTELEARVKWLEDWVSRVKIKRPADSPAVDAAPPPPAP